MKKIALGLLSLSLIFFSSLACSDPQQLTVKIKNLQSNPISTSVSTTKVNFLTDTSGCSPNIYEYGIVPDLSSNDCVYISPQGLPASLTIIGISTDLSSYTITCHSYAGCTGAGTLPKNVSVKYSPDGINATRALITITDN